jgi:hypothetical protein
VAEVYLNKISFWAIDYPLVALGRCMERFPVFKDYKPEGQASNGLRSQQKMMQQFLKSVGSGPQKTGRNASRSGTEVTKQEPEHDIENENEDRDGDLEHADSLLQIVEQEESRMDAASSTDLPKVIQLYPEVAVAPTEHNVPSSLPRHHDGATTRTDQAYVKSLLGDTTYVKMQKDGYLLSKTCQPTAHAAGPRYVC